MKSSYHIFYILFSFLIAGTTSCGTFNNVQYQTLTIQVLSAPDSMAIQQGRYLVVNRVPATLDTLGIDSVKAGEMQLDSEFYNYLSWQAINSCLDAIELSPLMDSIILDTLNHKELSFNSINDVRPLSKVFVKEICQFNGTDGLISLEQLDLCDTLIITPMYDTRMGDSVIWGFYALESIHPGIQWRVYSAYGDVIYQYSTEDTLSWDGMGATKKDAESKLLKEEGMLYEAMNYEGKAFGESIAPNWISVERIYYTSGNSEMKKAAKMASENDWLGAAGIWNEQAQINDSSLNAKACFNMAVAAEIMDKIQLAIVWINKSWTFEKDEITLQYSRILRSRSIFKSKMSDTLFESVDQL